MLALTVATVASAQTYTVLKYFNGSDGMRPDAGLVLEGSTLYGTTTDRRNRWRLRPIVSRADGKAAAGQRPDRPVKRWSAQE
jgi:hypothetical protein